MGTKISWYPHFRRGLTESSRKDPRRLAKMLGGCSVVASPGVILAAQKVAAGIPLEHKKAEPVRPFWTVTETDALRLKLR